MTRRAMTRVALPAAGLIVLLGASAAPSGDAAAGRYKKQGNNCVWDASDSGPNQCTPVTRGRFKKEGNACVWRDDPGEDQCRPAKGRFKRAGRTCRWDSNDSGPDQCNPRQPR
jgi:hypothetical protein